MSDIVKRLRARENDPMWADHAEIPKAWCKAAADEIERLRDDVRQLEEAMEINMDNAAAAAARSMRERAATWLDEESKLQPEIAPRFRSAAITIRALPLIEKDKS